MRLFSDRTFDDYRKVYRLAVHCVHNSVARLQCDQRTLLITKTTMRLNRGNNLLLNPKSLLWDVRCE